MIKWTFKPQVGGGNYNDELQSQTIDFVRFPLTVLIIYLHSFGDPLTENPTLGLAIYDNVRIFFSHILSRVAVPTFLVISGYLFFYKTEEIFDVAIYKKKLVSRYHSIFIPYVLWNLGYLLQIVVAKSAKIIIKHEDANIIGYFNEHGWLNMFWILSCCTPSLLKIMTGGRSK